MSRITVQRQESHRIAAPLTREPWLPEIAGADPFEGAGSEPVTDFRGSFTPPFEIQETPGAYLFTADVPGVQSRNLSVTVAANRLIVGGVRHAPPPGDDRYFTCERSYGRFARSFALPADGDLERVTAELKAGVLTVTVPKRAESPMHLVPAAGE
jgi:HSP20 family protein